MNFVLGELLLTSLIVFIKKRDNVFNIFFFNRQGKTKSWMLASTNVMNKPE